MDDVLAHVLFYLLPENCSTYRVYQSVKLRQYKNYNSFYNAKIVVDKTVNPIVSKHFFEKFLQYFLSNYVKFEKFISYEWCVQ